MHPSKSTEQLIWVNWNPRPQVTLHSPKFEPPGPNRPNSGIGPDETTGPNESSGPGTIGFLDGDGPNVPTYNKFIIGNKNKSSYIIRLLLEDTGPIILRLFTFVCVELHKRFALFQ